MTCECCADWRLDVLVRLNDEDILAEPYIDRVMRVEELTDTELLEIERTLAAGYAREVAWVELERRGVVSFP
ncbi:MAG TPA: hypothetical protein PKA33_15970 [Amaricoccus sp.]|uniref:hypothetical protein n=1 Tax=Amaricoccus sp. TaxID=1872485 RepID=UPI002CA29D85|nr:hypothetical protein [Amaricoccus sp.]HMQ92501.1 hypothetical protein [Amaricoccus sp.]HMR53850.1 hypothetical protein [Amaricoccus sp.]HMR58967.1 hypothetical protein [Amaricoccus sp.]HMU00845.1 hypothetical protein [Amaricoccus sp.]